jgi:DNA-directed RNA polymerase subunit M/transcription elongation factor TFIIS
MPGGKYCEKCQSVMIREVFGQTQDLELVCGLCKRDAAEPIKAGDEDVLFHDMSYKKEEFFSENVFKNASKDPTLIKYRVKCKECGHGIMKGVRHIRALTLMFVCANPKCEHVQQQD